MEGAHSQCTLPAVGVTSGRNNVDDLSIMYFNARSLFPKFDELSLLVESHNPDIISIVEPWLCADIPDDEICIQGYNIFRRDRNRHGGGVLMYIRNHFTTHFSNLEILPVVVRHLNLSFCIAAFYRPPSSSAFIFDTLSSFLASLNIPHFSHFVLLGDFNVNLRNSSHLLYRKFFSFADVFNLSQVVTNDTHTAPNGNTSLIDLVLTSSPSQVLHCSTTPPLASSDHNGIHLVISWKLPRLHCLGPHRRTIWRYAHADFEKAAEMISETDWDALASDDIDQYCSLWQSTFLSIMDQCIPKKVLPPRRRNLPWLNKSLVQSMRRRNCFFKKAKRSKSSLHLSQYKRARNRVTSQLRKAKKEYFYNLNTSDTKQFWKTFKVLNKHHASIGTLAHGDTTCHSDVDKANEFFCSCFNSSCPPISTSTPTGTSDCPPDFLCTEDEVCELLKSLDVSKANGPDGISARMLRSTANAIAPSLTKLFNCSIACGRPPADWKTSSVVPIPKKPGAKSTSDYRPISLLSILSKVLERHFHSLITDYLSTHHPLANCQWGFQPGKSTVSALLHTTHEWFQLLENGAEIGAIFFDFKKAFDTVPHLPLLSKLEKTGLDPLIIMWIQNYLAKRQQRVVVNGTSSRSSHVLSGVPQGSILGPLLFLIYIDDIADMELSAGSSLVIYADDILLYRLIRTSGDYSALQDDIDALSNWATQNAMTFNATKYKHMTISRIVILQLHLYPSMEALLRMYQRLSILAF